MAYCYQCGSLLGAHDKYCPKCGYKVERKTPSREEREKMPLHEKIRLSWNEMLDTTDHTSELSTEDIEFGRSFAMFSYLGPLFLVPLFAARSSRFARFHIGQGINLLLALLLYSLVIALFYVLLSWVPMFGNFFVAVYDIMEALGILASIALAIQGIVNTNNGKARELPFIGKIRIYRY